MFGTQTFAQLRTGFSYRKLRLRADRKSGVPVRQPPARCATPFTGLLWHGSLTWLSPCCSISATMYTPSVAFRRLPPNSARFSYATERALFISAQLPTDAVSALRKVRVLIRLWKQPSAIVKELCESRGGRRGLSVLTSLLVSVDVKIYWTVLRHWSQLVPNMSTDIWGH